MSGSSGGARTPGGSDGGGGRRAGGGARALGLRGPSPGRLPAGRAHARCSLRRAPSEDSHLALPHFRRLLATAERGPGCGREASAVNPWAPAGGAARRGPGASAGPRERRPGRCLPAGAPRCPSARAARRARPGPAGVPAGPLRDADPRPRFLTQDPGSLGKPLGRPRGLRLPCSPWDSPSLATCHLAGSPRVSPDSLRDLDTGPRC